ncbi:MAG: chloramphenicol acetyltransferase [Calditrichaeota bacterium]|nr:MAG: chloramphenicol acetyltransferase [Calditrichota bacterium]MBL1206977.1 chloramphenicol acetyltransferase [Calditrichota bacterium]NOG46804.1 chloramphenicol acetyltransferase [Calditrichota bacterium]
MKLVNKDNWNRREHFDFFSKFDEPFFGITAEIDCTRGHAFSREKKISFFSYYLHNSLMAVNKIEELRYRIKEDSVVIYDAIHASSTIGRDDGTFAFSFVEHNLDFRQFDSDLKKEIKKVQASSGLRFVGGAERKDVVHYSSLPWSSFTGLTHARNFNTDDSSPKITFGKMFTRENKKILPVAIYAHHGLADGYHVCKHLEVFQELMDKGF